MFSTRSEARDMAAVKESSDKARLVGINHVALEVGSIEEALAFYGRLFEFSLRGRRAKIAFIDMGDQFINLTEGRTQPPDEDRHLGLVVDDKEKVRQRLKDAGVNTLPGRGVEFRDPWGNRVQIVECSTSTILAGRRQLFLPVAARLMFGPIPSFSDSFHRGDGDGRDPLRGPSVTVASRPVSPASRPSFRRLRWARSVGVFACDSSAR